MRYLMIILSLIALACTSQEGAEQKPKQTTKVPNQDSIYSQVSQNWSDVLEAWYPRALDTAYGGYLANWTYDWQIAEQQNKMIVTQARHLWTTAKVLKDHPNDTLYQRATKLGFDFLKNRMWDKTHGGFYWRTNREGEPVLEGEGEYKKVYGHAFGIYALAAYTQADTTEEVLSFAKKAFLWLDEHAHDAEHGGYFSVLHRDGTPLTTEEQSVENLPVTWIYKEQNAGIHLLEAFTELYRVWPDSLVRERLIEMLHLVRDTMVNERGHLNLFFTSDWQPISYADSSQTAWEANYDVDHVSFGHDIETAFLMLDASEVLGNFEYDQTLSVAKTLVDHTLKAGFDPARSGIYQRGYYLPDDSTVSIIDSEKDWWSQAEGLNTLLLFAELYPDEPQYAEEFADLWKYTRTYLIDYENQGWYNLGLDITPESRTASKGQAWKANYHNGRTLMSLIARLSP
ncbi:AGE family epimerase/isomerase [Tunicatimonas pelagia]|uniref:AGE family epimerase/isomerase n=1 Tax=Tunicatimonas pelagia TaxID=931531 RepID=UPI0026662B1A|nr:AGE family epimerase/isomerase [Tunicatimonas pelagia]WKN43158.1 AGE family epimerase/isomerase [Tunicatimonas pelagia]